MAVTEKKYFILLLLVLIPITGLLNINFLHSRFKDRSAVPGCPWCEDKGYEDVVYIPIDNSFIRLLSPADPEFLADIVWMKAVHYFGTHALTDREYPYYINLLDIVTDLAPDWKLPFITGAVLLPLEIDALEEGFYIIDKGLIYHPNSWELLFFKGFYLFKLLDDKIEGAKMLSKAGQIPGSPVYLTNLAATLATKAGEKELAVRFIQEALGNVRDETHQKMLKEKMREVMEGDDPGSVME